MAQDTKKTRTYLVFSSCGKPVPKTYLNYFSRVPNVWPTLDILYNNIAEETFQNVETVKTDLNYLIDNGIIKFTPITFQEDDLII